MRSARLRNRIAIVAIALTTLLFTALFTIVGSIIRSAEEASFRQIGTYAHGEFKYLTEEQYEALKSDPRIQSTGTRRLLGLAEREPFTKMQLELSTMDENNAKWSYCTPTTGRLPAEGTEEAATDTTVLRTLGVTPELGAKFTVSFTCNGKAFTRTYTLCGYWEKDAALPASHLLVPLSETEEIWREAGVIVPTEDNAAGWSDRMFGSYNLTIMLKSGAHIEETLNEILASHGLQSTDSTNSKTFVRLGVNWGYTSERLRAFLEPETVFVLSLLLFVILFTGTLIIYNVFQISVTNDVRYYGLLKTVGTTARQLRTILRTQALILAAIGIPVGLILGFLVGAALLPAIIKNLNSIPLVVSVHPLIFVFAAVFSFITVLLSTARPGRLAGKVSPIEASRFAKPRRKNPVIVVSLTASALLLVWAVTLARGFDDEKFLHGIGHDVADFILADASYFRTTAYTEPLSETAIDAVNESCDASGGRVYWTENAETGYLRILEPEEHYLAFWNDMGLGDMIQETRPYLERVGDLVVVDFDLLGIEPSLFDKLTVLSGDIEKLADSEQPYIAAVYATDDYGIAQPNSNWAKVGDTVTLRRIDEFSYYDVKTGEALDIEEISSPVGVGARAVSYEDFDYEVVATVEIPYTLTNRATTGDLFLMNSIAFQRLTGTPEPLLYAFDVPEDEIEGMNTWMKAYTTTTAPSLDYESIETEKEKFRSEQRMYLLLGSVLSGIIGLIGALNFLNVTLTGILTRRREFATLQAVGMTGRQLRAMLIREGLFYTLLSAALTVLLTLTTAPFFAAAVEQALWFFTYRLTLSPLLLLIPIFLILGIAVPALCYRLSSD